MRALQVVVGLAVTLGLAGCGSDTTPVMPDVTGQKLDVAKSAIKDAGFEDEVRVEGGGVFGVVNESNWEVCEQSPASGASVSGVPRLTVDRSCGNEAEPAATPEPTETASETAEPEATEPSEPDAEPVLTKRNSKEFAALLAVPDPCDDAVGPFVAANSGRTIEFDGSISNMAPHGDADTRYDILVAPGNKGPESTVGPNFKFEDVNVFDLKLSGSNIPDSVGEGDRFRFVAEIDEYNQDQCLLFLEPVETKVK